MKKRVLIGGGIGVAIILILGVVFLSSPQQGQIAKPTTKQSNTPTYRTLNGHFMKLVYPGVYEAKSAKTGDATALEQYIFYGANDRNSLSVEVHALPSANLADDSDYHFRTTEPDVYQSSVVKIGPQIVTTMKRADGTEVTDFLLHAGKVLTINITDPTASPSLADTVHAISGSVTWK